jgi:hypothetical protein
MCQPCPVLTQQKAMESMVLTASKAMKMVCGRLENNVNDNSDAAIIAEKIESTKLQLNTSIISTIIVIDCKINKIITIVSHQQSYEITILHSIAPISPLHPLAPVPLVSASEV